MKKKVETKASETNQRRRFLMGAGVGVAAAGAALVASQKRPDPLEVAEQNAPATSDKSKGYHLSDHVKTYYKTLLV